jgi:WS/DGAT/MGAT family acyltransferase
MPQQHLDRLTSIDASFLHQERPESHMHIGGVLVFDGPPPAFADYLDHVRSRLHLVPRYRQKLATPPLQTGRPLWVDDPSFRIDYHVRHAALPAPGRELQLLEMAARIASQPLDRAKPLWENWLVEGLDGDRFALIFKTHHSLVDGVSGVGLGHVLFDLEPDSTPPGSGRAQAWRPEPAPSQLAMAFAGLRGGVGTLADLGARLGSALRRPRSSLAAVGDSVLGVGELVWAGLNPAPRTPLNVPIGAHRRYDIVRHHLADYKEVKDRLGGTVNDVVLTVVSGGLRDWLHSRGVRTEGLELRALVPVSVRMEGEQHQLGNRITVMRGPLPVYIEDPAARLHQVRTAMSALKESRQAAGAATLARVTELAPPVALAQSARLSTSTRLFNLIVTNVPGPQVPLYLLGRELRELFPLAFLPRDHALAIGVLSYHGGIAYGLLGDYDALPDLNVVRRGIDSELADLLKAARQRAAGRGRGDHPGQAAAASAGRAGSAGRGGARAPEPPARGKRDAGERPGHDAPPGSHGQGSLSGGTHRRERGDRPAPRRRQPPS